MARINKALLRKAKQQIQKAAKEGSEDANNILSRRKERQVERQKLLVTILLVHLVKQLLGTLNLENLQPLSVTELLDTILEAKTFTL